MFRGSASSSTERRCSRSGCLGYYHGSVHLFTGHILPLPSIRYEGKKKYDYERTQLPQSLNILKGKIGDMPEYKIVEDMINGVFVKEVEVRKVKTMNQLTKSFSKGLLEYARDAKDLKYDILKALVLRLPIVSSDSIESLQSVSDSAPQKIKENQESFAVEQNNLGGSKSRWETTQSILEWASIIGYVLVIAISVLSLLKSFGKINWVDDENLLIILDAVFIGIVIFIFWIVRPWVISKIKTIQEKMEKIGKLQHSQVIDSLTKKIENDYLNKEVKETIDSPIKEIERAISSIKSINRTKRDD